MLHSLLEPLGDLKRITQTPWLSFHWIIALCQLNHLLQLTMDSSFYWQWNTGQRDLYISCCISEANDTITKHRSTLSLRKLLGSQMKQWADPTQVGILQLLMWVQSQAASHRTEGLSWAFCMQTYSPISMKLTQFHLLETISKQFSSAGEIEGQYKLHRWQQSGSKC